MSQDIVTTVLVVGGSYAGIAAVSALCSGWNEKRRVAQDGLLPAAKLVVTLVEPRLGLLNVLGIPRAVVDMEFARTQYIGYEELRLPWGDVVSRDALVRRRFEAAAAAEGRKDKAESGTEGSAEAADGKKETTGDADSGFVDLVYVQGKITQLDEYEARYELVEAEGAAGACGSRGTITFDYCIVASGRDRNWPVTPHALTPQSYLCEMEQFRSQIGPKPTVLIIGGGAVGLEMAGDIKRHFPDKTVRLIHPHRLFPPEPLTDAFKVAVQQLLERGGVECVLETRVERECANGDLVTTTGRRIELDYNYWSNRHRNNTALFSSDLQRDFVNRDNDVLVNEYLQLTNATRHVGHIFVLGDLVALPIIKSAGWAMYMGRQAANNIVHHVMEGQVVELFPDLTAMPRGMVVVGGDGEIVSELLGAVEVNNANYVMEYGDYCFGRIRATLDV